MFERLQLEDDEQIIGVIRRHWFFLFLQCISVVVLMLIPLCGLFVLSVFAPDVLRMVFISYAPYLFFSLALWFLINWMMLALIWTDHYLDIWAITDRRIIKIDQVRLFNRHVSSFRLERLQDLTVEVDGILATLLDYGTIHAETASGHDEQFTASFLPHPEQIKSRILESADKRTAVSGSPL